MLGLMKDSVRSLAYLASALVTGVLGFGLLLSGWLAVGLLALTPLSIPALVAFRWAIGALAHIEARLARVFLGRRWVRRGSRPGGAGYLGP